MSDKAWKAAERSVARKLGTRRTPLSGGNSAHTRSDTLHHELFIEVKLRKRPPLWEELRALGVLARSAGRAPLMIVDHAGAGVRLGVTRLDVLVERVPDVASARLFDDFLVEHRVLRRCALFGFWAEVEAMARAEGKRPLLVFKASGRPGELAAWRPRGPREGGVHARQA